MSWKKMFRFFVILISVFNLNCLGFPQPEMEVRNKEEIPSLPIISKETSETEVRAGQENSSGGISSAMNNFQSGISTLFNSSNMMKDSKMVVGGFSFFILPASNLQQLGQLNPGMISQIPSLPGKK